MGRRVSLDDDRGKHVAAGCAPVVGSSLLDQERPTHVITKGFSRARLARSSGTTPTRASASCPRTTGATSTSAPTPCPARPRPQAGRTRGVRAGPGPQGRPGHAGAAAGPGALGGQGGLQVAPQEAGRHGRTSSRTSTACSRTSSGPTGPAGTPTPRSPSRAKVLRALGGRRALRSGLLAATRAAAGPRPRRTPAHGSAGGRSTTRCRRWSARAAGAARPPLPARGRRPSRARPCPRSTAARSGRSLLTPGRPTGAACRPVRPRRVPRGSPKLAAQPRSRPGVRDPRTPGPRGRPGRARR